MTAKQNSDIRMKDLFTHFLRRWKSILTVTVLCALVLGGWQYFSVKKVHDAGEKTKEEARYEDELATYQVNLKNAQDDVEGCTNLWKSRVNYRDNSLLMNLNPEDLWIGEKKYLMKDVSGNVQDVLEAYTGAMTADHEVTALQEAFGTENAGYAREVVSVAADPETRSLMVKVWASEEERAKKELVYVSGKIVEAEQIAQGIGSHTLQALNEGVAKGVYPELLTRQRDLANEIAEDEDTITRAKRMLNNVKETKPFEPGDPVVRWAVTGGVLGFLLMIAIYLTTFLRKNRITGTRSR